MGQRDLGAGSFRVVRSPKGEIDSRELGVRVPQRRLDFIHIG